MTPSAGRPRVDERDRHGPARVAAQKGLRPVDRIDDEETRGEGGALECRRFPRRASRRPGTAPARPPAGNGRRPCRPRSPASRRLYRRRPRSFSRPAGRRPWRSRPLAARRLRAAAIEPRSRLPRGWLARGLSECRPSETVVKRAGPAPQGALFGELPRISTISFARLLTQSSPNRSKRQWFTGIHQPC